MKKYVEIYVRTDGYTLSEEEYHALVRRETEALFPEWWEERSENYGTKEEGFDALLYMMYASESDYTVFLKCNICGQLVGEDEGHDWEHGALAIAVVSGIKFAVVVVDDEQKTAAEAVWVDGRWETGFSYPYIGVEAFEVAGALDFNRVRKMGYKIID